MSTSVRALLLAVALTLAPAATANADAAVPASGSFEALVDFSTLVPSPAANGTHCELTVQGTLTFQGTVSGAAHGTTTAYVLAPCDEVLAAPPGTYRDVFRFEGAFTGTVDGTPASGMLSYFGVSRPGGSIGATIQLRPTSTSTSTAVLRADAVLAVGGTYTGVAKP